MKSIPLRSEDLIKELEKDYPLELIPAEHLANEEGRIQVAMRQAKIELVQQLKRQLSRQDAIAKK